MRVNRASAISLLTALFLAVSASAQDIEKLKTGGPYVPTPQIVVDQMLKFGAVGEEDYVIDSHALFAAGDDARSAQQDIQRT